MYQFLKQLYWKCFFILALLLIACSSTKEPVYTTLTEASLKASNPIPTPVEEPILTVSGQIGTTNEEDTIVMDIPTLEAVGLVSYTVQDPFKNVPITYTGVLLSDLLDLWQVSDQATTLHVTALNDYQVDVPIQMIRDYPIIYALQADDLYMPISDKGPAMLVLPYDDYDFERPAADAFWIWQIKSIEVN